MDAPENVYLCDFVCLWTRYLIRRWECNTSYQVDTPFIANMCMHVRNGQKVIVDVAIAGG